MTAALPRRFAFGKGHIDSCLERSRYADRYDWELLSPPLNSTAIGNRLSCEHLVEQALEKPIGSQPLSSLNSIGGRICIAIPDVTRDTDTSSVVSVVLRNLLEAGADPERIQFLVACGIHRVSTTEEKSNLIGGEAVRRFRVFDHDADHSSSMVDIGTSSWGNRIRINRRFMEADLKILTGGISMHYFAGFTGGRKMVLPGIAHRDTIFANHLKVLGPPGCLRDPNVAAARLEDNPVHLEMLEAATLAKVDFIVNTVNDARGVMRSVVAGDCLKAHQNGCNQLGGDVIRHIRKRRELVLVGCGGFPRDINMIQAHKTMEYASAALEEGGTMILAAQCGQGYGHSDFLPWFRWREDLDDMAGRLRRNYQVYGQTALSLGVKAKRFRIALISELPGNEVRAMGLEPVRSVGEGLEWASGYVPRGSQAYVIPYGSATLPLLEGEGA